MRIEVRNKMREDVVEVYGFNLFNLTAVFVTYRKEIKPQGKRKWTIVSFWDKYGRNSTIEEPGLPDKVRESALKEVAAKVSVMTWKEFKKED